MKQLTPKQRGARTLLQAVGASIVGLFVTIWRVDGVPDAVFGYISGELAVFLGTTGVAGFAIGWLMNRK